MNVRFEQQFGRAGIAAGLVLAHVLLLVGLLAMSRRQAPIEAPTSIVSFVTADSAVRDQPQQPQAVEPLASDVPLPDTPEAPAIDSPIILAPSPDRNDAPPVESPAVVGTPGPAEPAPPKLVESVQYIRAPVTRYPIQSRKLRQQGVVILEVLVDERGLPARIKLERSSGYQLLDAAAREAMTRARFRPYTEDGVPRSVLVLVPLRFALNRANQN